LAKLRDVEPGLVPSCLRTQSGVVMGTPSYMAPEQAAGRTRAIGPATDVYAVGATLYEMLTGRPPFRGTSWLDTLEQVRHQEPVPPSRLQPKVPRDLETICLKSLEKEPGKRYPSAAALAEDLRRYREGQPIKARPIRAWERGLRWARRRPAVAVLLASLMLVTACGFAGITWQWRRAEGARADAEEARSATDTTLYFSRIGLAELAWRSNDVAWAEQALDQCVPRAGRADPRGWEWHYLKHLCHADLVTLRGHREWVYSVAYSPDGRLIASAGGTPYDAQTPGDVMLWDATTGRLVRSLSGLELAASSLAFSPDGQRLAVAEGDSKYKVRPGAVKIWDVHTGKLLVSLRGHTGLVWGVAFSSDGKRLASASADRTVKVWDVEAARETATLREHTHFVLNVACSAEGTQLASVDNDGRVRLWDTKTWQVLHTFPGSDCVAFSPTAPRVAAGGENNTVKVWDASTGQELQTLRGHSGWVLSVAFSPDGTQLASASTDSTVRLWDIKSGVELLTLRGHTWGVRSVAFSPDGQRLVSGSQDQTIKVWDLTCNPQVLTFGKDSGYSAAIAFDTDSRQLTTVNHRGRVALWDPATGSLRGEQETALINRYLWPCANTVLAADGRYLAAVSRDDDRVVKVLDVPSGRECLALHGHTLPVFSVAFSPDGTRLASAAAKHYRSGGPSEVKLWDAATGRELLTFQAHSQPVISLAFSRDGRLASSSHDGTVKVWDVTTGRELLSLAGHQGAVASVAFSRDGRRLASAGYEDRTVRLWDAATGRQLNLLPGRLQITHVAYSPDGSRLAAASVDVVKLWDASTGLEALTLRGHTDQRPDDIAFNARVAFSPDGRRLASTNWNQTINVWDAGDGVAAIAPAVFSGR
jgi:WD40 repeat protein